MIQPASPVIIKKRLDQSLVDFNCFKNKETSKINIETSKGVNIFFLETWSTADRISLECEAIILSSWNVESYAFIISNGRNIASRVPAGASQGNPYIRSRPNRDHGWSFR